MHSIRVKITAVTIVAILTSILALGGIGILSIGMESDRSSVDKMHLISENMQRRLDAYLDSIRQSVEMGIHQADDSLEDLDMDLLGSDKTPEEQEKLDRILQDHCGEVEDAFTSIADHTNGIVTYYYCVNHDIGSSERGFFWRREDGENFTEQEPLRSEDLDINDTDHTGWYYAPLKTGRALWVGPYKAYFLEESETVSYVAPIYRMGFLVGILGMDIPFDTMIDQVRDLQVYDTGFVFLMDKDGNILYYPEEGEEGTPEIVFENEDPDLFLKKSSGDELVPYTVNGEKHLMSFTTLSNNMKVAVTAPVSEINASKRHLTLMILLVAVIILAVFAVITLLLMDAMTRPLLKLTAAAKRLSAGDFDVELNYHGKDEVGILTETFLQMRDHLKNYITDLNSMVYIDAMTKVKNKGAFNITCSRLNDTIRLNDGRNVSPFAIVIFDCNDLKTINDQYGHNHGDEYLLRASRTICRVFAHSPVFRLGGDEFSVVLQGMDYVKREELMYAFDLMADEYNVSAEHPWEKVNISKGMAEYDPVGDRNVEDVLLRADSFMYEDKKYYKAYRKESTERKD